MSGVLNKPLIDWLNPVSCQSSPLPFKGLHIGRGQVGCLRRLLVMKNQIFEQKKHALIYSHRQFSFNIVSVQWLNISINHPVRKVMHNMNFFFLIINTFFLFDFTS